MMFYLRTQENKTLFEVETYIKDKDVEINATVRIANYSSYLLNCRNQEIVGQTFEYLSNLRGWYHEIFLKRQCGARVTQERIIDCLRSMLTMTANILKLKLVED